MFVVKTPGQSVIFPCPIHVTAAVAMNRRDADRRIAEVLGLEPGADLAAYRVLVADDGHQVYIHGDKTAIVELWKNGPSVPFRNARADERSAA
jgi:hypothetical protein